MKTVKRNEKGEVTHIRIENEFFTKADADIINFSDVNVRRYMEISGVSKEGLENLFESLVNEKKTIAQIRIQILKVLCKIDK